MEDQNQNGETEKEIGVVAQGDPGQREQQKMHDEGGNMDALHGITSFVDIIQEMTRRRKAVW